MSVFRFEMSQKSHFGYNSQNSQSVKNAVVVGGGGGATSEKKKEEEK